MKIKKLLKWIALSIMTFAVVFVSSGFTYERIARIKVERSFEPQGELISVGSHSLHALRRGDSGPTVIFESGLDSFGHLSWYKVERGLAGLATTVSYDRAGILWSERGDRPKTAAAMADELAAMLEAGGFQKPYIVVGHSLAGITLRPFIVNNRDDIAGVVLVDASHPDQINRLPPDLNEVPADWVITLFVELGLQRLTQAESFPNTLPSDRMNLVGRSLVHRSMPAMIEELSNVNSLANEVSVLTSFGDIPLRVVTGAAPDRNAFLPADIRDEMTSVWNELQEDMLGLSTNSRRMLATESGHYVQLDQPDLVVGVIRALLSGIESE